MMTRLFNLFLIFFILLLFSTDSSSFQLIAGNYINDEPGSDQVSHPKNIILMIGDGMGVSQIFAALTVSKNSLNIARCKYIGFSKTSSFDEFITDSGASGTAMASGIKTKNRYIGVDQNKNVIPSILEIAEENALSTGLVVTSYVTHATPAVFIAHNPDRNDYEAIALDFLKTDIDVFIGGGKKHFVDRKDGLNLIDSLVARNYNIAFDDSTLMEIDSGKIAGLLYDGHPPKFSEGRGYMLKKSSQKAIEILSKNDKGFFLMIEGSQIDWAGHDNDSKYLVEELLDFDDAVGTALDFAEKNKETLVIITADHETGGFAIKDGNIQKGTIEGAFLSDNHTAVMVPVFAYGPGAEDFIGIYENTEIFNKCMKAFGFHK